MLSGLKTYDINYYQQKMNFVEETIEEEKRIEKEVIAFLNEKSSIVYFDAKSLTLDLISFFNQSSVLFSERKGKINIFETVREKADALDELTDKFDINEWNAEDEELFLQELNDIVNMLYYLWPFYRNEKAKVQRKIDMLNFSRI